MSCSEKITVPSGKCCCPVYDVGYLWADSPEARNSSAFMLIASMGVLYLTFIVLYIWCMLLQGGGGGDASSLANATNAEIRFEIKEVCVHITFHCFYLQRFWDCDYSCILWSGLISNLFFHVAFLCSYVYLSVLFFLCSLMLDVLICSKLSRYSSEVAEVLC